MLTIKQLSINMTKIIKATKQDVEQICELFNEYDNDINKYFPRKHLSLLQGLNKQHGNNPKRRKGIEEAINDKNQLFLVVKDAEKVMGCVIGWTEMPNRIGRFDQLISSAQSGKKIVLKQLYGEVEKWFKMKKCKYIVVDVVTKNPRKKLYKEFGFDVVLEEMRKII